MFNQVMYSLLHLYFGSVITCNKKTKCLQKIGAKCATFDILKGLRSEHEHNSIFSIYLLDSTLIVVTRKLPPKILYKRSFYLTVVVVLDGEWGRGHLFRSGRSSLNRIPYFPAPSFQRHSYHSHGRLAPPGGVLKSVQMNNGVRLKFNITHIAPSSDNIIPNLCFCSIHSEDSKTSSGH